MKFYLSQKREVLTVVTLKDSSRSKNRYNSDIPFTIRILYNYNRMLKVTADRTYPDIFLEG